MASRRNGLSYVVPTLLNFFVTVMITDNGNMRIGETAVHPVNGQDVLDKFGKLISADIYDIQ